MNSRRSVSTELVLSRRIRKTPFEERVFENGARAFTVYNRMPLASFYSTAEEDYAHLKEYVQIWDVSCERQVEISGPDALALVELITPRDMSKCQVGQCKYAPLVDEHGGIKAGIGQSHTGYAANDEQEDKGQCPLHRN